MMERLKDWKFWVGQGLLLAIALLPLLKLDSESISAITYLVGQIAMKLGVMMDTTETIKQMRAQKQP